MHEPFFSFSVPPKSIQSINLNQNQNQNQNHSTKFKLSSNLKSNLNLNPNLSPNPNPNPNLRPNTAGPFTFNLSSDNQSRSTNQFSNQFSNPIDRPYSSSDLPASNSLPQTVNHSQTFTQSTSSNHVLKPFNITHLVSHSPLLTHSQNALQFAIPNQLNRPMTAPGPICMPHQDLNHEPQFSSPLQTIYGQMSSYPPQSTDLSGSELPSQTITSQPDPTNLNHLVQHSSPTSTSVLAALRATIEPTPLESSSGSSDPDSKLHDSNSGDYSLDSSTQSNLSHSVIAQSSRPSLGTRSSESTPASPDSLDGDRLHPQNYLHSTSPNPLHNLLRPSTHSGTSSSFGHQKFLSQPLQPRPTTGHLHQYEPSSHFSSSLNSQSLQYPSRLPIYPSHPSHIYEPNHGHFNHVPNSVQSKTHDRLYNFTILPGAPRKRARRRFDEVERLYCCNYPGCIKAYGTLNHLNAHISMQKHGPKRLPQEFKEIRKEWRAKKKAESEGRSSTKLSSVNVAPAHEYSAFANQDALRSSHADFSSNSSPDCTSGLATSSPAINGPYSAPAHSQQFTIIDQHNDWRHEYRANPATIDEQPEYIGNTTSQESPSSLLPNQSILPSTSSNSISYLDQSSFTPQHQSMMGLQSDSDHRSSHLLLNNPTPSIIYQS